ncbi:MAG: glycosyl hydrolase [Verrucomicrobia bacterium]|nr:glycosyl hydrolase [Verrucomicrobiota bacterium]
MKTFTFLITLALSIPCGLGAAESLEQQFRNPPESMKPYCYWYWLNGDITKDGITKDLEAMAKVGIQRAMIGNIQEDPKSVGPVKMFTPEWYALTRHAMKEAARVGVEISMFNAPGWSQSGGPWIKPEQSMRRITWNEIPAKGGRFSGTVRPDIQPLVQDVAVLAVPRKGSVTLHPSALTLGPSSWIWIWGEAGARGVGPGTRYFRRVIKVDASAMLTASMIALADDSYTLWINGKEVRRGPAVRNVGDEFSIKEYLKQGDNVIAVAVTNIEGSAGLIAALRIGYLIKRRGEEMFCLGINHFVLHVVAHQARDGVPGYNPGFGTSFHRNNPWFNESRDWVRYLQRVHLMLQQGNPAADVAVYIGDFTPQMTGPGDPAPAGYDFDYMGSDAILNNLDVVNGKWVVYDEKQRNKIAASYEFLTMPESGYIRPQVLKRLDELKQTGGKIPAVGVGQALRESGVVPVVSETTGGLRWKARELDDGMIFFLSNFAAAGKFEAKLRVTGKVPELFNPVTGEIKKLARYKAEQDGTRICVQVNDPSDSFFIVFREQQQTPSVVKVQADGKDVGPGDLALFYDVNSRLTAESASKGLYAITLSDGTTKSVIIEKDSATLPIAGEWTTTNKDEKGFSVFREITFSVPVGFGKGQKVELDLGKVEVMAQVTLNGKEFDTLWMPPFALDLTEALRTGENKLKVLVTSTSNGKPALGEVKLRSVSSQRIE